MPVIVEVTARKMMGRLINFRSRRNRSEVMEAVSLRMPILAHPVSKPSPIPAKSKRLPTKRFI